jgi:alcohol dehydrogenase
MVSAGYAEEAEKRLRTEGIQVFCFHDFTENPHSGQIDAGRQHAAPLAIDSIVGLGGGSSMDCAKGINFLLTNGGRMQDYWGYGKTTKPMLPMIGVPTTTGTGSEAQSYALIADEVTHIKMACGAPGAAFRFVVLDPQLARTQPREVLAATGYDAISHAVETFATTERNYYSECMSREAWRLVSSNFDRLLARKGPPRPSAQVSNRQLPRRGRLRFAGDYLGESEDDLQAVAEMQMGAHFAGAAIEHSMLGAAHACANPVTAHYGTTHGVAIAIMLAHVVRWNMAWLESRYRELHPDLPARLDELAVAAGLPRRLRDVGVDEALLPELAQDASKQWTGRFNPRPFNADAALDIYQCAY